METIHLEGNIIHETADPVSIELSRGQRGGYGWTIKVRGKSEDEILARIDAIDRTMRTRYAQPENGE